MGLRYMTLNSADDVRFDTNSSNSPVCSLESSATIYTPSSFNISPYTPFYHNNLSNTTYTNNLNSQYYSPNSYLALNEKQPRLSLFTPSSLSHLSRPTASPHPTSPTNTRDLYTGVTPLQLRRTSDLLSKSPSLPSSIRGVPLSPVSNTTGYTTPTTMDSSGSGACPPLDPTKVIIHLQGEDGVMYNPDIYAKIEKGFFMADKDWTCYRRNYFSINCSYTIHPQIPNTPLHLSRLGVTGEVVSGFAISIAASVDGPEGKPIELVQHTPKRDKGPQQKPDRVLLQPRTPQQHSAWGDNSLGGSSRSLYDSPGFNPLPNQPATEAIFERIQFKNATANNGKRRAAQQYYHVIVELFADLGPHYRGERYVKIAQRFSAPMVVRGRSPGHYQSERRGSNASSGPGSGGASGGGSYTPSSISRTPGDMNIGGSSSVLSHSAFGSNFDSRSHNYRANVPSLTVPLEATMPTEVQKSFYETPGYSYQYGPIYDGQENRYQRPNNTDYTSSRIKHEYNPNTQPTLPSLSSTGSSYDRWGSSLKSEPYFSQYPAHEINISSTS